LHPPSFSAAAAPVNPVAPPVGLDYNALSPTDKIYYEPPL
jgi:hypothetical protein